MSLPTPIERANANLLTYYHRLAVAYNALPGQSLQQGFVAWAKQRYPDQWAVLLKIGRRMNEFSLCQFKIDREHKA